MMQDIEVVEIVKVIERKVWIESDIMGDKHVMMQYDDEQSEPFEYCTLKYDHRYTSNSIIRAAAIQMAKALGAKEPVEEKSRPASSVFGVDTTPSPTKPEKCSSCTNGYNGTHGNGYQPCGCK